MKVIFNQRAPVGVCFLKGAEGMAITCRIQTKQNEWQDVLFEVQPYLDSCDSLELGRRVDDNSFNLNNQSAMWCRIKAQSPLTLRGATIEDLELRAEQRHNWPDGWRVTEPRLGNKLSGRAGQELKKAIVDFLLPYIQGRFDDLFKLARQRQVEYIKGVVERIKKDMKELQESLNKHFNIKV